MTNDYRLPTLGYQVPYSFGRVLFQGESHGPNIRFPDVGLMDDYFHQLEDARCKKLGAEVSFFTN
jgi:hypothetical protein